MSKESYERGFCKAAEAAGVDPVALAKYAQQFANKTKKDQPKYNTGGRAPEGAWAPESGKIPQLTPSGDVKEITTPWLLEQQKNPSWSTTRALRGVPWFRNWYDAHTNAIHNLTKGQKFMYGDDEKISPNALRILAEQYHNDMYKGTNGADRVTIRKD